MEMLLPFWLNDTTVIRIVWGSTTPHFNFRKRGGTVVLDQTHYYRRYLLIP